MSGSPPPPTADIVTVTPILGMAGVTDVQQALEYLQSNKDPTVPPPPPAPPVRNAQRTRNANVPPVPSPLANAEALTQVCIYLRQGIQSLAGQTGGPYERAVTLQDLLQLGLVTPQQLVGLGAPP